MKRILLVSFLSSIADAAGRVVAPGFTGLHSHADRGLDNPALRFNQSFLYQGVTTPVVNGRIVLRDGQLTGAAPGRVLRHRRPDLVPGPFQTVPP